MLLCAMVIGSLLYSLKAGRDARALKVENKRALGAEADARTAEADARIAEEEARGSELLANRRLYQQLRTQIQLAPTVRRPGQKFDAGGALRQAVKLLPKLNLSDAEKQEHKAKLRDDAITALARFDVQESPLRRIQPPWTESLVFNGSHETYAQSDLDGNISIRRFEDDQQIALLPGPGLRAWVIRFSPDDRFLAVKYYKSKPNTLVVWDLADRRKILEVNEPLSYSQTPFTDQGRQIAVGLAKGEIRFYNLPDGTLDRQLPIAGEPSLLCYSPSTDQLAVVDRGSKKLIVFHLKDATSKETEVDGRVEVLAWSSDGLLAGGRDDGSLIIWRSVDSLADPTIVPAHRLPIWKLTFLPGTHILATSSNEGLVRIANIDSGQELLRIEGTLLLQSEFMEGGRKIGFSTEEREFGVWQLPELVPWQVLSTDDSFQPRWDVDYWPRDENLIVTATDSGIEFWDAAAPRRVALLEIGVTKTARFNGDGSMLITSGEDGVRLWPVESIDRATRQVKLGPPQVVAAGRANKASMDASESRIAVFQGFTKVSVVDRTSPKKILSTFRHKQLQQAAISPDGKWVVSATWQGTGVRVWDATNGQLFRDLDPDSGSASVAFSPDGRWLAVSNGMEYSLWEVESWKRISRTAKTVADGAPAPVAFSADGRLLAVPYSRQIVQFVDPKSGRPTARLRAQRLGSINLACRFSPSGKHFAHANDDGVHTWNIKLLREQLREFGLDWE